MRWFAYVDTVGKWHINELLTRDQIQLTYSGLPKNYEAFASIQNYDAKGVIQSCPLYIDVDSSSLYDAWQTTLDTWKKILVYLPMSTSLAVKVFISLCHC